MRAAAANLLKILQGTKHFIIPIYQRTYRWGLTECQQLWDDALRVAQDDNTLTHFFGSIVYVENGIFQASSVMQLLLIDGQQRLTTLFLFLAALAEILDGAEKGAAGEQLQQTIRNIYLFNADEKDDMRYKLLLTQNDRETLIYVLEGGEEPHHISSCIKQNYEFFKKQFSQSSIDPIALYKGIAKLTVIDISLEPRDNPQLIFEGLNSTGAALSQADLIRNYVLMGLDHKDQAKLYRAYWYPMEQRFGHTQNASLFNRFMRDYLTIKSQTGEIPNIDRVYAVFKSYQQSKSALPMSELVADIYHYSKYFTNMAFAQEKEHAIRQLFSAINTLQVNVAYPFLLQVYQDYEKKLLSRQDFVAILKLVESYVFRRAVCGIPTNSLNKIFATLAREIDRENYLASVEAAFLQKTANGRFPGDEEFRTEFVVKDMYNFRNRNYLLNKLENYKQKEPVVVEECTIEHILPQNKQLSKAWRDALGTDWQKVQAKYLHTIGNLTLTAYNVELSDHSFQEKRDYQDGGFKYSPIRLSRSLATLDHWNEEEIKKRARALAERALEIWPMPLASPEIIYSAGKQPQQRTFLAGNEALVHSPTKVIEYTLESHLAHLPFDIRGIFERLRKRILNLDSSVKEEIKKHSIAYIAATNFVDIQPQKKRLLLTLHATLIEIDDLHGLCRRVAASDHYSDNRNIELSITSLNQVEGAMDLVRQVFEKQTEEIYR